MSRQQQVRDELRSRWDSLLERAIEPALRLAQEQDSADAVLGVVWPQLRTGQLIHIDRVTGFFLARTSGVPDSFTDRLNDELELLAEPEIKAALPGNTYASGAKFRAIIAQDIQAAKQALIDLAGELLRRLGLDRIASPGEVKKRLFLLLVDRLRADLPVLLANGNEDEAKRRLKAITALATPGGDRAKRDEMLRRITRGRTSALPYVLKYLVSGVMPAVQIFDSPEPATTDGFGQDLLAAFPEAELVLTCLGRYLAREGVLCRYIPSEGGVGEELEADYEALPSHVPLTAGGLFVPKDDALREHRLDWLRMPDGIACAIGLATLIESVLRQAVIALKLGGPANARGGDLVKRLVEAKVINVATADQLAILFDQHSLSLRDAMAHSAFFADDRERVDRLIAGLSRTLDLVVTDFDAAGIRAAVFSHPRWDNGQAIPADMLATIEEQYQAELNLVHQLLDDEARRHVFLIIKTLTPDKRLLGWAGFLLWIAGPQGEEAGQVDDAQQFAGLFAGLIVLEELLRAIYEVDGRPVLQLTTDQAGPLRFTLSILDDEPGGLLDPTALNHLFRHDPLEENAAKSFLAIRAVRDKVFHGAWSAVPTPLARYNHLVMKLIFRVCAIVSERPLP